MIALEPTDAREARRTIGLIREAVRKQWEIPAAVYDAMPKIVLGVLTDKDATKRDRIRAAEVLAALQRDNIAGLEKLDKIERLDSGQATEVVTLSLMPPRFARHHANPDPGAK